MQARCRLQAMQKAFSISSLTFAKSGAADTAHERVDNQALGTNRDFLPDLSRGKRFGPYVRVGFAAKGLESRTFHVLLPLPRGLEDSCYRFLRPGNKRSRRDTQLAQANHKACRESTK